MSELTLVDSNGQIRPAIKKNCQYCKTEFITYSAPSKIGKFCSLTCSQKSRITNVSVECSHCKKLVNRKPSDLASSKSGFRFCSKKCKGEAQRLRSIPEILPDHYFSSKTKYRSQFTDGELVCSRCGYKEFTCSVEVHHKDGNHDNNIRSNLVPLCANCHRAFHNNKFSLAC